MSGETANEPIKIRIHHFFCLYEVVLLNLSTDRPTNLSRNGNRMEDLEKEKRSVVKSIDTDAAAKKKQAEDGEELRLRVVLLFLYSI